MECSLWGHSEEEEEEEVEEEEGTTTYQKSTQVETVDEDEEIAEGMLFMGYVLEYTYRSTDIPTTRHSEEEEVEEEEEGSTTYQKTTQVETVDEDEEIAE
eukprot:scaffold9191_cov114-Cylindrotheca_fusiformis.AAC.11